MTPRVSSGLFEQFFAWAPWIVGLVIYFAFYVAKRHEVAVVPAVAAPTNAEQTFACDVCGRRGSRDQMVAQDHGGAIGYRCASCAQAAAATVQS